MYVMHQYQMFYSERAVFYFEFIDVNRTVDHCYAKINDIWAISSHKMATKSCESEDPSSKMQWPDYAMQLCLYFACVYAKV